MKMSLRLKKIQSSRTFTLSSRVSVYHRFSQNHLELTSADFLNFYESDFIKRISVGSTKGSGSSPEILSRKMLPVCLGPHHFFQTTNISTIHQSAPWLAGESII
jgi:hypothetical protein